MTIQVQSVLRFALPRYIVKVYRNEDVDYVHTPGLYSEVEQVVRLHQERSAKQIADAALALERVVCVEVIDWDSNSILYFK